MDTLRTIIFSPGGRPIQRVNLADPTGLTTYTERSTFKVVPPTTQPSWARNTRRFGGAVMSAESKDNWTAQASWWIKGGGDPNQTLANAEAMLAEVDDVQGLGGRQPKHIEWRPDGASQSIFMDLRGAGIYTPQYDWAAFAGAQMLKIDMSWPVGPLAYGAPLDIGDPFDVDSRSDYSIDLGPALLYTVPVPGGQYGSIGVAGTPAETAFRHTARGYEYTDVQTTAVYIAGTGTPALGVTARCLDGSNHLLASYESSTLVIYKKDAGIYTSLASIAAPAIASGHQYTIRIRTEDNLVTAELFDNVQSSPLGNPTAVCSTILAGANATKFGAGIAGSCGIRAANLPPAATLIYFEAAPYTFASFQNMSMELARRYPTLLDLKQVPGTAPAEFDVSVSQGSAPVIVQPANPVQGLLRGVDVSGVFPGTGSYQYAVVGYTSTALSGLAGQGLVGETQAVATSVTVVATTDHVDITWFYMPGATGYNIYRQYPGGVLGGIWVLIASVSGVFQSYRDLGGPGLNIARTPPAANTAYSPTPQWGLLGWSRKPSNYNRVWNGDFEIGAAGWITDLIPTGSPTPTWTNAASAVRNTVQPDVGSGHLDITYDAVQSISEAASFPLVDRFHAGRVYTFTARLASPTLHTANDLTLAINDIKGNTLASQSITPTGSYQTVTITWTADKDYDFLYLVIAGPAPSRVGHAYADQMQAYEGTAPPTLRTQQQGRGARPPIGLLDSIANNTADFTVVNGTFTTQAAADVPNQIPETVAFQSSSGSSGSARIAWWIDPHLMAIGDDFQRGTIAIEVFWRGACPPSSGDGIDQGYVTNPRLTLSAQSDPAAGTNVTRYTQEFGILGRPLSTPSTPSTAAAAPRLSRLGTILLPVNPGRPVRWKLVLDVTWTAMKNNQQTFLAFSTDYLLLAPVHRRACNPTGKPRSDASYPVWQETAPGTEFQKTICSDLSGRGSLPLGLPLYDSEDTGVSGASLELQPPPVAAIDPGHSLLVKLSNLVPDDPTGEGGETAQYPAAVHVAVRPRYRLGRG